MAQWDNYTGDGWMLPDSSRETQAIEIDRARATKSHSQRPSPENSPWRPGEIVAGFELIRSIGFGSHGWVFEARETATHQTVALKLIPSSGPKDAVRSKTGFRRMGKLRHPGLVRLHRIVPTESALAFSMELIDGENLVQVLRQWKWLPLQDGCERLLEMLRQIGSALAWAHAHQLVHRDIKPTNLMMTKDGNRFVIVDCDLAGVLEAESDPQNIRSYLIWTPMYVAPEVLFRQSYCPASDIFSLGMVALEALRMFSSAQRRRDRKSQENHPSQGIESASPENEHDVIPRDDRSSEGDREFVLEAMVGLHPDIPECLLEIVHEMLSPDVPDRPTAMAVSRVGCFNSPPVPVLMHSHATARAERLTEAARSLELLEFRRWCHLVLGGKVKRLHIEGISGIGKSTFLQLALEGLRSQSWPMVFVARCQRFEQIPLQAFSQIADEIVIRYRRGGFEKIMVDSVSESILQRALPGFGEILEIDWSQPPIVTSEKRPGGLEAAMKVCNKLREVGPVFFVIDDVQWADEDTLNILDHLQSSASGRLGPPLHQGLGLITVSRSGGDHQQFPPDATISLGPIASDIISRALRAEAKLNGLDIDDSQVEALSEQIEGEPYRLAAYLSELSPAGLLRECFTRNSPRADDDESPRRETPTIEEVWQHRSDRLSPRVSELLKIIVVAGRQIKFEHLAAIEGNAALLETQLDELDENRLIVRDGADGQYIRIWHDRLARQLLSTIPLEQRQRLHHQWAESLAKLPLSAGQVAEHYEQAGDIPQFVHWANQAAVQADQVYAHLEAARWHRSVASHSTGAEKIDSLRLTAERLQRSGRLFDAAQVYQELSELQTGQAKLDAELEQVECLIRSGHFAEAVEHLDPLLASLNLPQRKPPWLTKLSIVWNLIRQSVSNQSAALHRLPATPQRSGLKANQMAVCRSLVRPLSMLDNWLSADLNVFNRGLVQKFGTRDEQIELVIGTAVFDSYRPGRKRRAAEEALAALRTQLTDDDSPGCHGDVCSGIAWSAGMSGRYSEAITLIEQARKHYADSELHHGFEVAHTSFLEAICYFQMGDLKKLTAMVEDMQAEGTTTNDFFVLAIGSLGYSSVAFLMQNDLDSLTNIHEQLLPRLEKIGEDALAMASQFESLHRAIYLNIPEKTEAVIDHVEGLFRHSVFSRNQLMQVLVSELSAMGTFSLLAQPNSTYHKKLSQLVTSLRRQRLDAAEVKADLLEGIAMVRYPGNFSGDLERVGEQAEQRLKRAIELAEIQGLIPTVLAARDELARLNGDPAPDALDRFLREQGVVDVEAFSRLYRGAHE